MEDLMERGEQFPAALDGYVQQGRMFLFNAAQNLIQYGRVLVEAKPLVPRGRFESWVQSSFGMSERTAQNYMKVWKRFGGNKELQTVQFSNLQKMLALPEGQEEQFAQDNDLKNMTAREVEKAVLKVREEADAKIRREREARLEAERRAEEAERREPEPDRKLIASIAEKDAAMRAMERDAQALRKDAEEARRLLRGKESELENVRRDLRDAEQMLAENQQEYDRMQSELLNAQSTIARGDAERVISDQLTVEDFAAAVRGFLGSAAQMPYMAGSFSQICDMREFRQWDELLSAVEDWARNARKALNTLEGKGEICCE